MPASNPTDPAAADALSHTDSGPHSPARLQSSLDPALIEAHGRALLHQALNQGRTVCFLGSGVSMAYGRLTWRDMVEMLVLKHLDAKPPKPGNERARQLLEELNITRRSPGDDLQSGRYPAAFQYLEELLKGAQGEADKPQSDALRRQVRGLLYDDHGQVFKLIADLAKSTGWDGSPRVDAWWENIHLASEQDTSGALRRQDIPFMRPMGAAIDRRFSVRSSDFLRWRQSLSADASPAQTSALSLFDALAGGLGHPQPVAPPPANTQRTAPDADADVGKAVEPLHRYVLTSLWRLLKPADVHALLDEFLPTPGAAKDQSTTDGPANAVQRVRQAGIDPLKLLHADLRISRFITTNYDLEVERLLHYRGYEPLDSGPDRRPSASTVSTTGLGSMAVDGVFRTDRATELIEFAVATTERKVHVMHLHGRATDDASMVVTEQDYLDQYLGDGGPSEIVSDALDLTFTANTVLFVGSGMSEDDVLRPLRQFVNERRSRHDKSAIVLVAAAGSPARQIEESIAYYARYGVHTVHYGVGPWVHQESEPVRWLATLLHLRNHLQALLLQVKANIEHVDSVVLRMAIYSQLAGFDLLSHAGPTKRSGGLEKTIFKADNGDPLQIVSPWFQQTGVTPTSQASHLSRDLQVFNGVIAFVNTLFQNTLGFDLTAAWRCLAPAKPDDAPQRTACLAPLLARPKGAKMSLSLQAWSRPLYAALAALAGLENSLFGAALHLELGNINRLWHATKLAAKTLPQARPTGGWNQRSTLDFPDDHRTAPSADGAIDAQATASGAETSAPPEQTTTVEPDDSAVETMVRVWSRHPIALRAPIYRDPDAARPPAATTSAPESDRFFGAAPSFTFRRWYESLLAMGAQDGKSNPPMVFKTCGRRIFVLLAPRGVGKGHFLEASKTSRRLGEFIRFSWPQEPDKAVLQKRYAGFAFFNLSFSLEVTSAFDRLAMLLVFHAAEVFPPEIANLMSAAYASLGGRRVARLKVLMQLYHQHREQAVKRLYVAFSAFNTLFDERGFPKNAQLYRIVMALLGPDMAQAPIDFVLVCTSAGFPILFTHPHRHHRPLSNPSLDSWRSLPRIQLRHIAPGDLGTSTKADQRRMEQIEVLDIHIAKRHVRGRPTHHAAPDPMARPSSTDVQAFPGVAFLHVLQDAKTSNTVAKYFPEVAIAIALRCQPGQDALANAPESAEPVRFQAASAQFLDIQRAIAQHANTFDLARWLSDTIPNVFASCAAQLTALQAVPADANVAAQGFDIRPMLINELEQEKSRSIKDKTDPVQPDPVQLTAGGLRLDAEFIRLAKLTGRNRFMLSLVCAVAAETGWSRAGPALHGDNDELHVGRICEWLDRLSAFFDGSASEAREDRMIGMALDEFQRLHEEDRVPRLPQAALPPQGQTEFGTANEELLRRPLGWKLQQQLLWHMALIGHPVEADVLASAPQVAAIAIQLLRLEPSTDLKPIKDLEALGARRIESLVAQAVDILVRRCLVFRLNAVNVNSDEVKACQSLSHASASSLNAAGAEPASNGAKGAQAASVSQVPNWRFAVHRFMQRAIFIRLHAPFVEQPSLDQEGLSLWVSQPDDLPRPSRHALDQLDALLCDWIGLPSARTQWRSESAFQRAGKQGGTQRARMLHAAFGVVRTFFSVGVIARFHDLDAEPAQHTRTEGYFEQHRQKVEGLIKQAASLRDPSADPNATTAFYDEEIVWLYNECGLFYLVQGRLDLAAEQFELALRAAARLEGRTDRGALWCRIHLNLAVVDIERGQLREARRYLLDVRDVPDENPILRVLAQGYLALVEHYSGNFQLAIQQYTAVIDDLEGFSQSRSAAIFSRHLADLYRTQGLSERAHAYQSIDRAIAAATKGGHEDVRRMAVLSRIRLLISDPGHASAVDTQASLDEIEAYGHAMGMPRMLADVAYARATHLLQLGETRYAATLARRAISIATANSLRLRQMTGLGLLSRIYQHRGLAAAAGTIRRRALEMAEACDYANVRSVTAHHKAG